MIGETDVKLTPLYEIEMMGFTEEVSILKYVTSDDIYRLAEFNRDTTNKDAAGE